MGRRLSSERRAAVLADIAAHLDAIALAGSKSVANRRIVALRLSDMLGIPGDSLADGNGHHGLESAADELAAVCSVPTRPGAMDAWIERYLDPTSADCLNGTAALWTKAVNRERDRARRCSDSAVTECPARIGLLGKHRKMLAELVADAGGSAPSSFLGRLIEAAHRQMKVVQHKAGRPRKVDDSQQAFDLLATPLSGTSKIS